MIATVMNFLWRVLVHSACAALFPVWLLVVSAAAVLGVLRWSEVPELWWEITRGAWLYE